MEYGIMKVWAMMFTCMMCYVDGGEGGGNSDNSGGAGDTGASGGDDNNNGGGENGAGDNTLLAGKYKDADALLAGYIELNTAFSGKDEAHQAELAGFKTPEAFEAGEGWGNDNPMDNRMMAVFQEVAKEHNMTQGMYEGLVNGMVEMQERVEAQDLENVMKSIPNFQARAGALADTASAYLRPDQAGAIDALLTSKESFEAMEILMGQVRGSGLPTNTTPGADMSQKDLRSAIRNLNPADTAERARLMGMLNASGGEGEGTLS